MTVKQAIQISHGRTVAAQQAMLTEQSQITFLRGRFIRRSRDVIRIALSVLQLGALDLGPFIRVEPQQIEIEVASLQVGQFDRHDVGIVYSNMVRFGAEDIVSTFPDSVISEQMCWKNYIHCGSLVRREALENTEAYKVPVNPKPGHEDWLRWRKVLALGWRAKKQTALYAYRRHPQGASLTKNWDTNPYYRLRALDLETITLFVPLSGRMPIWPRFSQFLETQLWPREQTKLYLLDTSQSFEFSSMVRTWLSNTDYRNVCYHHLNVGSPGLADAERRDRVDVQNAVRLAAARIYNHLAHQVTTPFVWIVEDDIIPPDNAAELLLKGYDQNMASVAGPYRSRFHDGYVAWTEGRRIIKERGEGIQAAEGNGFGCVMLRGTVLKDTLFTCRQPPFDSDPAFYARLKNSRRLAKHCWDAECEHLDSTTPLMDSRSDTV